MHEMGLCFELISTLDDLLKREGVSHITSITLDVGEASMVVPRFLLDCWEAAKAKEKHAETTESKVARLPDSFPALLKLQKVLKKLTEAGLENDCPKATVRDVLVAACGALKSGADLEPDLIKEINALSAAFFRGEAKKVTDVD